MLGRRRMYLDVSTWEQKLQELIQQEKPWAKWTLKLDENIQPGGMARGWRQYMQRAFGRTSKGLSLLKVFAEQRKFLLLHSYQVLLFLMPSKLGFCSSEDPVPHVYAAPDIQWPGASADFCSEVPEVFLVSI
ncbi:receptor-transporting protein 4 isoform X2 [Marmota marmota marmota]|uniref:receptor-transporting protein 4 isoform X2 n=1 Tax=Marmota marmota marmota TaxID=9994 RepID=UPI0007627DEC|nr:receptor-transporting protein 4 isoform X2 [Marmota marmota marmota]